MLHTPITVPDWTADRRVALILASCAANPPEAVEHVKAYVLTRDAWRTYRGPLVEQLTALYTAAYEAAMAHWVATDDYSAMRAWLDGPTVDEAISRTIGMAELVSYATDAAYRDAVDQQVAGQRAVANAAIDAGMAGVNARQAARWAEAA